MEQRVIYNLLSLLFHFAIRLLSRVYILIHLILKKHLFHTLFKLKSKAQFT